MTPDSPTTPPRTRIGALTLSYLARSAAAAVVLALWLVVGAPPDSIALGAGLLLFGTLLYFPQIFLCALPGFAILRLVMGLLRRRDAASFVVAGVLNGVLTNLLFKVPLFDGTSVSPAPLAAMVCAGGVAGWVAFRVERARAGRASIPKDTTGGIPPW